MTVEAPRIMRGRVVIREELDAVYAQYKHLVIPEWCIDDAKNTARRRTFHIGRVLAMGPPPLTRRDVEVAVGFAVGDRVIFHWEHHEEANTREWPPDGQPAAWVPVWCVDAVVPDGN